MDLLETYKEKEEEPGSGEAEIEGKQPKQEKVEEEALRLSLEKGDGNRTSPATMSNPNPLTAAQLTIFYNGAVSVYDAVPAERAQAIMLIAAAAAAASAAANDAAAAKAPVVVGPNAATAVAASPVLSRSPSVQSSSAATGGVPPQSPLVANGSNSLCKLQAELPMARRHSLQRFLEKRRDRLVSKAPYVSAKSSDGMEVASEGKPQLT